MSELEGYEENVMSAAAEEAKAKASNDDSEFVDDGKDGATTFVMLKGDTWKTAKRVNIRELDPTISDDLLARQNALEELQRTIQNTPDMAPDVKQKGQRAAIVEQVAIYETAIENAVRSWELSRPYSMEEAKKLHANLKLKLFRSILRASMLGAGDSDF